MLFLAVTLGFFAENMREENVEHHREIEYIKSMIQDLNKDTANINNTVKRFENISLCFDTILQIFDKSTISFSQTWSNNFVKIIKGGYPDYYYTDRTLQQLKNSGSMRLIKNQIVSNAIVDYDNANKDFMTEDGYLSHIQQQATECAFKVWSFKRLHQKLNSYQWFNKNIPEDNYWIIKDKATLEYFYNILSQFRESENFQKNNLVKLQKQAIELISLLNNEYHLEK